MVNVEPPASLRKKKINIIGPIHYNADNTIYLILQSSVYRIEQQFLRSSWLWVKESVDHILDDESCKPSPTISKQHLKSSLNFYIFNRE